LDFPFKAIQVFAQKQCTRNLLERLFPASGIHEQFFGLHRAAKTNRKRKAKVSADDENGFIFQDLFPAAAANLAKRCKILFHKSYCRVNVLVS